MAATATHPTPEQWAEHLRARNLSEITIHHYTATVRALAGRTGKPAHDLLPGDIHRVNTSQGRVRPLKPATISRYKVIIRTWRVFADGYGKP